jgi:hypothetical protein
VTKTEESAEVGVNLTTHVLKVACFVCESLQDALVENAPELLLDHVTVPAGTVLPDSWTVASQMVGVPTRTVDLEHVTPTRVTVNVAERPWVPSLTATV